MQEVLDRLIRFYCDREKEDIFSMREGERKRGKYIFSVREGEGEREVKKTKLL